MSDCATCRTWGRVITLEENPDADRCPTCGRLYWPDQGVTRPAGYYTYARQMPHKSPDTRTPDLDLGFEEILEKTKEPKRWPGKK